ncbi:MAG: MotA/TolQ/ExbB proton channel family protein [Spirochaetales bacterium]|nr:MotA/TolQ/ExbB proton channel family protein [Spirochaetales bacterium]
MFTLLAKGGIIMAVILFLSVIATVIIVERFLYFRKIRINEESLITTLKASLEKRYFNEAISICENSKAPIANIMKVGIENRRFSQSEIKESILSAANREIPQMERYLSPLGTIANISPLLGLLGTVTGNIKAFGILGSEMAVGDPSVLAGGISEALITTAAGLIVSIPCIIFYNHLVNKVNHMIIHLENRVNDMVLLLKGDGK